MHKNQFIKTILKLPGKPFGGDFFNQTSNQIVLHISCFKNLCIIPMRQNEKKNKMINKIEMGLETRN